MLHLAQLVLAAAVATAPSYQPHEIRDSKDAIDSAFDQLQRSPEVDKREWTAKRVGKEWVVQRKDDSIEIYLDGQTGRILRTAD